MSQLFDAARTLTVSGAALPAYGDQPILTPVRLRGTEALGELFAYTLELTAPAAHHGADAPLALDALLGTEVTVSIEIEGNGEFVPGAVGEAGAANLGAGTREITGLVTHAAWVRSTDRASVHALTLRPWLWLATRNRDCRLFQDMTVVEITDEVLSAYPFSVDKRLIETYPKRDIQRQHWESDFTFVCRLWQEWGLYFWFEHSDGRHRLVLCDSIGAHRPHGPAYRTLRYEPAGRRLDEEHIHALSVHHTLTPGTVATVDYDYTWPRADLRAQREDSRDTAFAQQEHYAWGDYAQPQAGAAGLAGPHNQPQDEGDRLALVRVQAERAQGVRAHGQGNLRGLVTGQTFTLTHHPQPAANRDYLIVSSTLDIEDVGKSAGAGQHYRCQADFEIQPTSEVFRLQRTIAQPRTQGPETAVVVGPAEQEIWTDAYGRVKVQFPWDRQGQCNERSSCWLRIASSWQGNAFGATHLPRVGDEVIVDHLRGDPDRPLVTGRVVNAFHLPAWTLPANQALSGWRSRELGGSRANHLVLDDSAGKLQAQLSSDQALSQLNLGSLTRIAGNAGRQEARGEGFELRTDAHGVVRAARGLLITTEGRFNAKGHAKDMGESVARLDEAERWQARLAQLAQQAKVQEANDHQDSVAQALARQNRAIRGASDVPEADDFPELSAPHLVMAGVAGIHSTTPASTHITSGRHIALTSGDHTALSANGSLFASAQNTLRLFSVRDGMKAVAADGDIDIHALRKAINLLAQLEVNVTSDTIQIKAKKKLVLNGGGSYIELEQGMIKSETSGHWIAHAAHHYLPKPGEVPVELHSPTVCVECLLKAAERSTSVMPRL